jgi:hypothetical protein
LEQLTLYRKTSLIIYVKGNKQVAYQAKLFSYVPLMEPNVVTRAALIYQLRVAVHVIGAIIYAYIYAYFVAIDGYIVVLCAYIVVIYALI